MLKIQNTIYQTVPSLYIAVVAIQNQQGKVGRGIPVLCIHVHTKYCTLYQHILENSYPAKNVCQNYDIFWF